MRGIAIANSEETDDHTIDTSADERSENGIRTDLRDPLTGSLQASEKAKLMDLLGRWEEPDKVYDSRHVSTHFDTTFFQFDLNTNLTHSSFHHPHL